MTSANVSELFELEVDLREMASGCEVLPDDASLAFILAASSGEEIRPEWNLAAEIRHLLDASLVRCSLDPAQGDDDLPEPVRQRLEAAWRTAYFVQFKVRAWEALEAARRRAPNGAAHDVCAALGAAHRAAAACATGKSRPRWALLSHAASLLHDAAQSSDPEDDVTGRLQSAIEALESYSGTQEGARQAPAAVP